jgi:hypothetical protein
MNKIYDKLILAVALLLLAGGVFLYFQNSSATPSLDASVNAQPGDKAYIPQEVLASASTDANWPLAEPQSTGWRFDVFTPPKIFIDANGQFTEEGWEPPVPPPPFGIYLASIDRKPYRIQLEGYIEEDRSDSAKTLLLMYDEEAQQQVRARPGDEKPDAEFKLLSFDIDRIRDADNNVEVIAKATILDERLGEEVVLTHGERRYDSGVTVVIRSEEDPNYVKELTEVPIDFEGPMGQYTLLEINLEDTTVTVKKQGVEDEEPETRILKVHSSSASSQPKPNRPRPRPTEPGSEIFDMF